MSTEYRNSALVIANASRPNKKALSVHDNFVYIGDVIVGVIFAILYLAEIIKEKK